MTQASDKLGTHGPVWVADGRVRDAQIILESWRKHDNSKRPIGALAYRAPAPEAIIPMDQRPTMHKLSAWPTQGGRSIDFNHSHSINKVLSLVKGSGVFLRNHSIMVSEMRLPKGEVT